MELVGRLTVWAGAGSLLGFVGFLLGWRDRELGDGELWLAVCWWTWLGCTAFVLLVLLAAGIEKSLRDGGDDRP